MALLLAHHFRCSLVDVVKHRKFLDFPLVLLSPAKARSRPGFVRSSPETEEPRATAGEAISSGQGFGQPEKKKQQKGAKRVIRRSPVERPAFLDKKDDEVGKQQGQSESAFLLSWLVLGALILIQGILLAASGFLPEEWDKVFVKYLYPSFTPTVALFVAGTVTYGVIKYLQNENAKTSK